MCARVPEIGWVFACQQDEQPVEDFPPPLAVPCALPDGTSYLEAMAQIAEHIQMSTSIVQGIRAGNYSPQQAAKLIKLREELIETIKSKESAAMARTSESVKSVGSDSSDIIHTVGSSAALSKGVPVLSSARSANTPAKPPRSTSPRQTAGSTEKKHTNAKCSYKVCHSCRPLFQDRMYASFEAVLHGEVPQLTNSDAQCLPVMDLNIAVGFGTRQPPTPVGFEFHNKDIATYDTDDEISVDWTPTTQGGDSFSEHLNIAELFPCPGPHQCPVSSRYSGCAYDTGFDDGQRAANHGFFLSSDSDRMTPESLRHVHMLETSSTASSISLPTPATASITPLLSTDDGFAAMLKRQLYKARSADFPSTAMRSRYSSSSFGSEIGVHGGVALKEESVSRGIPDILTD